MVYRSTDTGRLHSVADGKGDGHDIHAHNMGRHFQGAQLCHDQREGKKADAHKDLLYKRTAAHVQHRAHVPLVQPAAESGIDHLFGPHKGAFAEQRADAHTAAHHRAEHGGNGCALHLQPGKSETAFDQQKVAHQIDEIGGDIGLHGKAGVSTALLRRIELNDPPKMVYRSTYPLTLRIAKFNPCKTKNLAGCFFIL